MSTVFDCQIQARVRDVNAGGHVDSVEAIRVLDEARIAFLHHAHLDGEVDGGGLLKDVPSRVSALVASQRLEYRAEMRFVPFQPFRVRIWLTHIGRSSLTLDGELRVTAGGPPAVVAETTVVLFDTSAERTWPITDQARTVFESYLGDPIALRERPTADAR
ncbi:acyl-CoA thioesterase [Nocardioides sambongensis]|uniref:acyl-CoA thioesterase n=1 Tax=Nocardioides sambongensis TaxID=2589074 RepID=UPI0015E8518D|nr:thioesterase family protein [Nocardioides sambongensis]